MIIGITGDFERGKAKILKSVIKKDSEIQFDYEPLPGRFDKYTKSEKIDYFKTLEGKNVIIDEIEKYSQLEDFRNFFNDFKLYSIELSDSLRYLRYVKKRVSKGFGLSGKKTYHEFLDKDEKSDLLKCMDNADVKISSGHGGVKHFEEYFFRELKENKEKK